MPNATHPVRVKPVEWTVLPADSLPVTVTSLSAMARLFASYPGIDPQTVPIWRNRRRLAAHIVPQPTLW